MSVSHCNTGKGKKDWSFQITHLGCLCVGLLKFLAVLVYLWEGQLRLVFVGPDPQLLLRQQNRLWASSSLS